ncbi:MAG: 16S rRNA pseudouridine(516) synthase, partial [Streptococcus sanguinis]|nr:16S rRNA pseudouridine(516) synthase [Streptococcus sanguinis]
MGPLQLDPALALGEWRRLTEEEMLSLAIFGVEL